MDPPSNSRCGSNTTDQLQWTLQATAAVVPTPLINCSGPSKQQAVFREAVFFSRRLGKQLVSLKELCPIDLSNRLIFVGKKNLLLEKKTQVSAGYMLPENHLYAFTFGLLSGLGLGLELRRGSKYYGGPNNTWQATAHQ